EIAEKLNLSNSTVYDHLKRLGFVSKLDIWVPHNLKEIDLIRRITICDSLLKRKENEPFLKRIITGDEKWIVYDNVKRKRSWSRQDEPAQSTSKADRTSIMEIGWTSNGHLSDFHYGDIYPMELWRYHGSLIDVHLTSIVEIDVPWSYGGFMDIHWMLISMWERILRVKEREIKEA
ncbi:histone-lysine N-methyltransferase SETMAR-like, partial [Ooceraea biroi]|uniref:histone-lysine N-methyltransferase SETMAR-like n=1 Tax=Ooceraea biroi TaxID=2015173 RepID=UPI000F086D42